MSESSGSMPETDVCVVGAGPAGITLAGELMNAGLGVCLIESGTDHPDQARIDLARGEIAANPYFRLEETRARAFGGTSHLWQEGVGLRSRALDPIDFEERPGIAHSGWPFGFETMAPFYRRAHELCRLGPFDYSLETWHSPDAGEPLLQEDPRIVTRLFRFGESNQVFQDRFDELKAAENVTVLLDSEVMELRTASDAGRVQHAIVQRSDGSSMQVRAKVFVLAAGGIENARLLLLSRSGYAAGLGNENDLVGRFFQEHLRVQSGVVVPEDHSLVERIGLYQRHFVDGRQVVGVLTIAEDTMRAEGLLNVATYLRPTTRDALTDTHRSMAVVADALKSGFGETAPHFGRHLRNILARPLPAARIAARRSIGRRDEAGYLQLSFQTEQAPNPNSRIVLGSDRDRLGRPLARLEWHFTDLDRDSIRRSQEILDDALRAASLGRVERFLGEEDPPVLISGFWHHIGTTRMHADPKQGVVDGDCRIHSTSNAYVAGSSVFPTGGFANPTLTIVALTLRLADHLKRVLAPAVLPPN